MNYPYLNLYTFLELFEQETGEETLLESDPVENPLDVIKDMDDGPIKKELLRTWSEVWVGLTTEGRGSKQSKHRKNQNISPMTGATYDEGFKQEVRSNNVCLENYMAAIKNVDNPQLQSELLKSSLIFLQGYATSHPDSEAKGLLKTYLKKAQALVKESDKPEIRDNMELQGILKIKEEDLDKVKIADAFALVLAPFVLAAKGIEALTGGRKKKKEQERQTKAAKQQAIQSLQSLSEAIKKQQEERLALTRAKIDVTSKPKLINLPAEKKITLSLDAVTKRLLGYKVDATSFPSEVINFAQAVQLIVTSDEAAKQQEGFSIMLEPGNAEELQTFLVNLAGTSINDAGISQQLYDKMKNLTGPLVQTKLDRVPGAHPVYSEMDLKVIQLDLALYVAMRNTKHPGKNKDIPTPYIKNPVHKLGYPDIFWKVSETDPSSKETKKAIDLTWYIYAMEAQDIFKEKDKEGKDLELGEIFEYLSVLPDRDIQRDVVLTFAHKYRTIKQLSGLDKDTDALVRPTKPINLNYREYLIQLINSELLPSVPQTRLDPSYPVIKNPNETSEQIIVKYLYYLVHLRDQKNFQEKLLRLENQIKKLQKVQNMDQKQIQTLTKEAQKAYQDLTNLLKDNNNTRTRLYNVLGAPVSFGIFVAPSRIPFDGDDPEEKALFEDYKKIYEKINGLEKEVHDVSIQLAKKQAEEFSMTYHTTDQKIPGKDRFAQRYNKDAYGLSFTTSLSPIQDDLTVLTQTINNSNFEIKNTGGVTVRSIRAVDVYNQISNPESFDPYKHIAVPTLADSAEILSVFDNDRNKVSNYLTIHNAQPKLGTRSISASRGNPQHEIVIEDINSDSYHLKQLHALTGLLHKVTIPGYGTYITESISMEAFRYLQNREKIFDDPVFVTTQSQKIKNRVNGFINDTNPSTNAKFIFLPEKSQGGPYQLFFPGTDMRKNLYFATIDEQGSMGLIGMPPHNGFPSPATSNDPFIYKKRDDNDGATGYGSALEAQQQRQLVLDNDPALQNAETILLEARGILDPILKMLDLYQQGNNGDVALSTELTKQVGAAYNYFNQIPTGATENRRAQMQTAITHIRIYIKNYESGVRTDQLIGPYESTILKFKSIQTQLEQFLGFKLSNLTFDTRDSAALYAIVKTILIIAGTITVTILSGGADMPFLAMAGISVGGGMVTGRMVDEGRYFYMNHVSPYSFQGSDGRQIMLNYKQRSDVMMAINGDADRGDVMLGLGQEFSIGMFWYFVGAGLVQTGTAGLTRFQKWLNLKNLQSGTTPQLQRVYKAVYDRIDNKLMEHVDLLESHGMKSFFKQFGHEFIEESQEEGLSNIGEKIGGSYGGVLGAVMEAAIAVKAGKRYHAGGVQIRPHFQHTTNGSNTTVYFRNETTEGGQTNSQLIQDRLRAMTGEGRAIVNNSDGSFIATQTQITNYNDKEGNPQTKTVINTMEFKPTTEPSAILDMQHDPELADYHITQAGEPTENADGTKTYSYDAEVLEQDGPSLDDWMTLLRYHNLIILNIENNRITAKDAHGNTININMNVKAQSAEILVDGLNLTIDGKKADRNAILKNIQKINNAIATKEQVLGMLSIDTKNINLLKAIKGYEVRIVTLHTNNSEEVNLQLIPPALGSVDVSDFQSKASELGGSMITSVVLGADQQLIADLRFVGKDFVLSGSESRLLFMEQALELGYTKAIAEARRESGYNGYYTNAIWGMKEDVPSRYYISKMLSEQITDNNFPDIDGMDESEKNEARLAFKKLLDEYYENIGPGSGSYSLLQAIIHIKDVNGNEKNRGKDRWKKYGISFEGYIEINQETIAKLRAYIDQRNSDSQDSQQDPKEEGIQLTGDNHADQASIADRLLLDTYSNDLTDNSGLNPDENTKALLVRIVGGDLLSVANPKPKIKIEKSTGVSFMYYDVNIRLTSGGQNFEYSMRIPIKSGSNEVNFGGNLYLDYIANSTNRIDGYVVVSRSLQQAKHMGFTGKVIATGDTEDGTQGYYALARRGFAAAYPKDLIQRVDTYQELIVETTGADYAEIVLNSELVQAIKAEAKKVNGNPMAILMSSEQGRKWRFEVGKKLGTKGKQVGFVFDLQNGDQMSALLTYEQIRNHLKEIKQLATLDQSTLNQTQKQRKEELIKWIMSIDDFNFDLRLRIAGLLLNMNIQDFDQATTQLINDIHDADLMTTKGRLILENRAKTKLKPEQYQILMERGVCGIIQNVDAELRPIIEYLSGPKLVFDKQILFEAHEDFSSHGLTHQDCLELCGINQNSKALELIQKVEIVHDPYDDETICIHLQLKDGGEIHTSYAPGEDYLALSLVERGALSPEEFDFSLIFDNIVEKARERGISHIGLNASKASEQGSRIGYRVWPWYGFVEMKQTRIEIVNVIGDFLSKTPLPSNMTDSVLLSGLRDIQRRYNNGYYNSSSNGDKSVIRDIYNIRTKDRMLGAEFWKEYGVAFYGEYYIAPPGQKPTECEKTRIAFKKYKNKN